MLPLPYGKGKRGCYLLCRNLPVGAVKFQHLLLVCTDIHTDICTDMPERLSALRMRKRVDELPDCTDFAMN